MPFQSIVLAAALGLAGVSTPNPPSGLEIAQAAPFVGSQGQIAPMGLGRDFMTTSEGCTYRRTKAPGYPERWILVVNPQRLGLPKPPRGCHAMR